MTMHHKRAMIDCALQKLGPDPEQIILFLIAQIDIRPDPCMHEERLIAQMVSGAGVKPIEMRLRHQIQRLGMDLIKWPIRRIDDTVRR